MGALWSSERQRNSSMVIESECKKGIRLAFKEISIHYILNVDGDTVTCLISSVFYFAVVFLPILCSFLTHHLLLFFWVSLSWSAKHVVKIITTLLYKASKETVNKKGEEELALAALIGCIHAAFLCG